MPKELEGYRPKSKAAPVNISIRLRELMVAKALGYAPHEWDRFPRESKAEMIATVEIENKIAGYQHDSLMREETK